MYGAAGGMDYSQFAGMFDDDVTLVLNKNNELINKLSDSGNENAELIAQHVYDLARMAQEPLSGYDMAKFIERSSKIILNAI